jgi:hypothetical protein
MDDRVSHLSVLHITVGSVAKRLHLCSFVKFSLLLCDSLFTFFSVDERTHLFWYPVWLCFTHARTHARAHTHTHTEKIMCMRFIDLTPL